MLNQLFANSSKSAYLSNSNRSLRPNQFAWFLDFGNESYFESLCDITMQVLEIKPFSKDLVWPCNTW